MLLETMSMEFRKVRSVNATDTSFPSKIPTVTEPAGDAGTATGASVIDIGGNPPGTAQNGGMFVPYGLGANNDTFSMRVIAWRVIRSGTTKALWVPVVLCEVACTMSASVGVALAAVLDTEQFVDTITLVTGNDDVSIDIVSPTADEIAHFVLDLKGCQKIECTFDNTLNTPSMNCLLALL